MPTPHAHPGHSACNTIHELPKVEDHLKEEKGNPSRLIGSKESSVNGKRKGNAQEETLVVSATMRSNVEKQSNRPLLLQNRRRKKAREKCTENGARLEKRSRRPCKDCNSGKCTNQLCDSWHPRVCQIAKRNWGKFGEKCAFMHREVGIPTKPRKKTGGWSPASLTERKQSFMGGPSQFDCNTCRKLLHLSTPLPLRTSQVDTNSSVHTWIDVDMWACASTSGHHKLPALPDDD